MWDIQPQGVLSPAVSGEESGWVLPGSLMRGHLQVRGVTGGGEGVGERVILFPAGRREVIGGRIEDPGDFCRKTRADFGTEV